MEFNKMIPELSVTDIRRSKEFYVKMLKFNIEYERPENRFVFLSYHGAQLMLDEGISGSWSTGHTEYPFGRGINFQFFTDDIDSIISTLKRNNTKLFKELFISEYQIHDKINVYEEIMVQDPDGYLLRFSELKDIKA